MNIQDNTTPSMCSQCGGRCCQRLPGNYHAADFGSTEDEVKANVLKALKTGRVCIDWYESMPEVKLKDDHDGYEYHGPGYFLRPAIKGSEGQLSDPTWGGECTFLGPNGCEHQFKDRPVDCRSLSFDKVVDWDEDNRPMPHCSQKHTGEGQKNNPKYIAALTWLPYWDFLNGLIQDA